MKIGVFAKKYGVSIDTVRYYIKIGLLNPEKHNQYFFDRQCEKDMEFIMTFKDYLFSIEEIHDLLSVVRVYDIYTDYTKTLINSALERKKEQISSKIEYLSKVQNVIEQKIYAENVEKKEHSVMGIPLSASHYLCCPVCKENFSFQNAVIKNNNIISAKAFCECGYSAQVIKGIIVTKTLDSLDTLNYKTENTLSIYYKNISTDFKDLHFSAEKWCRKTIVSKDKYDVILTVGEYSVNALQLFLKQDTIPKGTTFVFYVPSFEKAENIRFGFQQINTHINVIFIVGNDFKIPIKESVVDIFLDVYSNYNHLFYYNDFVVKKVKPYLKKESMIAGIFIDLRKCFETLIRIQKRYESINTSLFNFMLLKKELIANGFENIKSFHVGGVNNPGDFFKYHSNGEKINLYAYFTQLNE